MISISLVTFALYLAAAQVPATADPLAMDEIDKMFAAWDKVNTLTMRQIKTERMVNGKTITEEVAVKVRRSGEVYLANINPKKGQEALYLPKRDKTEITAHPGSFPDITVHISLWGGLATRNQHHLLSHAGFGYLLKQIRDGIAQARSNPTGEKLEWQGEVLQAGRAGYRLVLISGTLPAEEVEAQKSESVVAFGERLNRDPYLIVYTNPELLDSLSSSVSAGTVYKVPQYYGGKTEIIIDKETHMPLKVTIWDFEGRVYEKFENHEIRLNPPLTDKDFDPDNDAYHF
ncbi:MAG: DUF1571 domain-containing protein [Desulfobacteraceae bacterium]|nr:DUF1571 domain-containing protein [Desulfobacteraceae bacterium]